MTPTPLDNNRSILSILRNLHSDCSGAYSTEYLLILSLVVLPIGLMMPIFLHMARVYSTRMFSLMGLPFP